MKILILSSLYPFTNYSTNTTPVVHYFVREWAKLGHNVMVVHNENSFPFLFYLIPKMLKKKVESRFGVRIPRKDQATDEDFILDEVKVFRRPMLKWIPFGKFFNSQIQKQSIKISRLCSEKNFKPEVVVGHWEYPQIEIIENLSIRFPNARTAIVFHGLDYILKSPSLYKSAKKIDFIGFRSMALRKEFEDKFGNWKNFFICQSGLPSDILKDVCLPKQFNAIPMKFIYVGLLINRKFPDVIINSLSEAFPEREFTLNIVGEGILKNKIQKQLDRLDLHENVEFHKKISRQRVFQLMYDAEVFVMISKDEVFGLVYLEAMINGCIVIASRNEGIDGVIIDDYNGFLCEAGNQIELTSIIVKIKNLSKEKLEAISKNAINTAKQMSDVKMAKQYLKVLID